jgi:hypothetical protein
LPADAVDLKFSASGVEFTYADGLPRVTEASGSFHLTGTVFDIDFDKARVPLPSGKALSITGGNMQITKLALADLAGHHDHPPGW